MKEAQDTKNETFLGESRAYLYNLLQAVFWIFLVSIVALFLAVHEVNSKHSQNSRNLTNFQGKCLFSRNSKSP